MGLTKPVYAEFISKTQNDSNLSKYLKNAPEFTVTQKVS